MGLLQASCANCGHSLSFHSKQTDAPCKAIGCHAGPNGFVCQGFEARADAEPDLIEALSAAT